MVNHHVSPPFGEHVEYFCQPRNKQISGNGGKRSQEWMGMELCMKGKRWLTVNSLRFTKVHGVGVVVGSQCVR